jgi:hypothetical protein
VFVFFVMELCPHFRGKVFHQERFGPCRDLGKSSDILGFLKVGSTLNLSDSRGRSSTSLWFGSSTTSELFFFVNHGFNSIIHVLNKLSLASTKSSFV